MSTKDLSAIVRTGLFLNENEFKEMLQKHFPNSDIDIEHIKHISVKIKNKETGNLEDLCEITYS